MIEINQLPLHPQIKKHGPLRLSARTQDFHSCKRGSIPLGTTKQIIRERKDGKSQIIT